MLPRLKRLHVVFIGPELEIAGSRPGVTEEDFTCESALRAGKRFTCEFQPSTYYHTYCRSPQFRPPQAICAFNAGIYRTTGHERRDSWKETIPYLVRDGVPLVLTAYTLLECPQDVARIQQEQKVGRAPAAHEEPLPQHEASAELPQRAREPADLQEPVRGLPERGLAAEVVRSVKKESRRRGREWSQWPGAVVGEPCKL